MRAFRNSRKYRKTKRNLFSIKIREILRINIGGRKVERYFFESFEIQGKLKKKKTKRNSYRRSLVSIRWTNCVLILAEEKLRREEGTEASAARKRA